MPPPPRRAVYNRTRTNGSVMEIHHTYLKNLNVTLKTLINTNPLFKLFFIFFKEL